MPTSISHLGGRARVNEPGRYRKKNNKNLMAQGLPTYIGMPQPLRNLIAKRVKPSQTVKRTTTTTTNVAVLPSVNAGEVGLTNLTYNNDGSASIDVVLAEGISLGNMHFDIDYNDATDIIWAGLYGITFSENVAGNNSIDPTYNAGSSTVHDGIIQGSWDGGPAIRLTFANQWTVGNAATQASPDNFINANFAGNGGGGISGYYGYQYIQITCASCPSWTSLDLVQYIA